MSTNPVQDEIIQEVSNARVEGRVGRRSSFEVTINGKQVFSKLAQNGFPVYEKIVEEVIKASKGVEVSEVAEVQSSKCVIS
ncbi:Migration and invasion enhancer 1 [Brachionus plicatilis]|uniref:Migration and invasion enhancer 1 n=1 Tax=Brachionus plicatilis TaxID=10195 RepID=A0A3M7SQH0_BRAPC|nr:Migration and invasion enhancer 1 [Brachionus plicatilis]